MNLISPKGLRLILKTLSTINEVKTGEGNKFEPKRSQAREPLANLARFYSKNSINKEMQAKMLNRSEQSALMKELLNLPKDIKQLLAMLAGKNTSQQAIAQLLKSSSIKIKPEILQQLLQTNSKEVINKLIKLVQQSPANTQGFDQLKSIIALLGQIIPGRESTPQEILTHLLLLYLPWLPLMEDQKIQVQLEKNKSGGSDDEDIALVIYISTINLGRFKATFLLDKNNKLDILIEHISEDEAGDKKEEAEARKEILEKIYKAVDKEIKEDNINAKTNISEVKQKNFQESEGRDVTVTEVNNLTPAVLVAAQKVARIILELDEKICLLLKRKEDSETEKT